MSHHPGVFKATLSYEGKVAKWDALDADLKNLAQLASAASIGCSWCMDFGYFAAHSRASRSRSSPRSRAGASPTCSRRWSAT